MQKILAFLNTVNGAQEWDPWSMLTFTKSFVYDNCYMAIVLLKVFWHRISACCCCAATSRITIRTL